MKYLSWFFGFIVVVLATVYVFVFTAFGNSMLQPIIESKINEATQLDTRLKKFSLSLENFEIELLLDDDNTILCKGEYFLFEQSFNIHYNIALHKLESLHKLTQTQLYGAFNTEGSISGDMNYFEIDGVSDLAKSATSYHIEMTELNPTSIIAKVKALDLPTLLHMLNQKQYASATVNLDVDFKNIKPHQLDGSVSLNTEKGKLNTKVMKKDFNITIPKTAFSMNLDAKLLGDDVDYTYTLHSNLAKVTSKGKVVPQPLTLDTKYSVDVKELAVLKPLTHADVRGPLHLKGNVTGSQKEMLVDGSTNIASSKTKFFAVLKEFQPSSFKATIKGLKLQKLLYMLKQPHYANAVFDADIEINDANPKHLEGIVTTKITKGLLDSKYLTKAYEFESRMPKTYFKAQTYTAIKSNKADTQVKLSSTLADLEVQHAVFNLQSAALDSDYKVKVHNLAKLYFVTQRELKGKIVATGRIKKDKDLDFTMHSDVAKGAIDAKLHNDDFYADINKLQTLDILDMLVYPQVFQSLVSGKLKYNLAHSKGDFAGKLINGKFTKNQVLDLTKKYAKVDLYKERFKGDVSAKINKEHLIAMLDLKSNKSAITTRNAKLNTKTKQVDAKIDIVANKHPLSVTLKGSITSPKVKVDASKIIEKEAKKAIEKELKKHINSESINKLFKGLF